MHTGQASSPGRPLVSRRGGHESRDGDLRARDAMGGLHLPIVLGHTAGGVVWSLTGHVGASLAGQILLRLAPMLWFVVRHEAGHMSLFGNGGHRPRLLRLFPASTQRRAMAAKRLSGERFVFGHREQTGFRL